MMSFVNLRRGSRGESFGWKANWCRGMAEEYERWVLSRESRHFSRSSLNVGRRLMGRYEAVEVGSLCGFRMGMMIANFQRRGK